MEKHIYHGHIELNSYESLTIFSALKSFLGGSNYRKFPNLKKSLVTKFFRKSLEMNTLLNSLIFIIPKN